MQEVVRIIREIKGKNLKPIYFLMGDEPYFIDQISNCIAQSVLSEEEKGFNQMVLYGRDTTVDDIVGHAKRYPMMAERQVVIVKEAQDLSRTIEKLTPYAKNPQSTTVLVLCFKNKKLDKRKKLGKAVASTGVLFESKKLYENKVPMWIQENVARRGCSISPKANVLLVEFLGTDLGKIDKELAKLQAILPANTEIAAEHIEKHIGISKDYNNFELKKAIGERNVSKAMRIINYFSENPKENPFVVTISLLNTFFVQLLKYHGLADKSKGNIAKVLGVNPYFVAEYQIAAKNYPMKRVSSIISSLRKLDVKGKGVGAGQLAPSDLFKELLSDVF